VIFILGDSLLFLRSFLIYTKEPLFEFGPEIERTFHKLKRQKALLTASRLQWQEEKKLK